MLDLYITMYGLDVLILGGKVFPICESYLFVIVRMCAVLCHYCAFSLIFFDL